MVAGGPRWTVGEMARRLGCDAAAIERAWREQEPLPDHARAFLLAWVEEVCRDLRMVARKLREHVEDAM